MMQATEHLMADHRNIERLLVVMERTMERLEDGEEVLPETLDQIVTVIERFSDGFHHAKEEQFLFPTLERAVSAESAEALGCMVNEHGYGKACAEALLRSSQRLAGGEESAAHDVMVAARAYVSLLRHHIFIEDSVLFHLTDRSLDGAVQAELASSFDACTAEDSGVSMRLLKELEETVESWD